MGDLDRVLNRLDKIGESVVRNEATLSAIEKSMTEIKEVTADQEKRIQVLDMFKTKIIAYSTVVAIIFSGVFKLML